ncbi:MAG: hypothetical protein Q4G03_03590 [Planctomycetia bacterium]|nr:hypothetical protein [Planctomycetia bacterium]
MTRTQGFLTFALTFCILLLGGLRAVVQADSPTQLTPEQIAQEAAPQQPELKPTTDTPEDRLRRGVSALERQTASNVPSVPGTRPANGAINTTPLKPTPGKIYAVLVGYDALFTSPMLPPRLLPENDVKAVAKALQDKGVESRNIAQLVDNDPCPFYLLPTRDNILATVASMANSAGSRDTLLVVVSGEGASVQGEPCFLAKKSNLMEVKNWIALSEIQALLSASKAQRIFLLWLADRVEVTSVPAEQVNALKRPVVVDPKTSFVTLFACSHQEIVNQNQGYDLFLQELLEEVNALDNFDDVDWFAIIARASQDVVEKTKDFKSPQKPEAVLVGR